MCCWLTLMFTFVISRFLKGKHLSANVLRRVSHEESTIFGEVCLMCLEGSDCEREASCDECSGVACTRITSFNLEDNREVALTCIPYDTRTFTRVHMDESGCRRIVDREICVCYSGDYCNSASLSTPLLLGVLLLNLLLV
ncbi:hypothetical protein KIN20_037290 [Parelaphostrongylus tenuis]|uniref:Uncharacterized protein n=2 Tax=Strongyloidea TaxID=27829 RepID=A0AAD5RHQ9_PARTN|nr:hypothetical protein KIN20_037290 [Parelaphostrongylus tenuis]